VRILVFGPHQSATFVEQALAAGADGYLTQSSAAETLIEAVRTIASGRRWLSREVDYPLALCGFGQGGAEMSGLSGRQSEVLRLFARGLEFDQIADVLHLNPKIVAEILATTKQKLGVCSSAELMRLALSDGISAG
jgi:DNA-binding NarL/FixJ family response regulator